MEEHTRLFLKDSLPFLHRKPDESLRAIDAQVAEKIMGWVGLIECENNMWAGYRSEQDHENGNWEEIPHYSTDLNLAYEVVYVMSLGFSDECFSFGLFSNPSISSYLRAPTAIFVRGLRPPRMSSIRGEEYTGEHSNPATAICLAALEAIKGNE